MLIKHEEVIISWFNCDSGSLQSLWTASPDSPSLNLGYFKQPHIQRGIISSSGTTVVKGFPLFVSNQVAKSSLSVPAGPAEEQFMAFFFSHLKLNFKDRHQQGRYAHPQGSHAFLDIRFKEFSRPGFVKFKGLAQHSLRHRSFLGFEAV